MDEIWKVIDGFGGAYMVSNIGRVKNVMTGRVLRASLAKCGYPIHYLQHGGSSTKKGAFVHRLLAIAFIPNPNNLPHVNHIDGCKTNFSLGNLEWVTPKENTRHAIETGLFVPPKIGKGDECRASKLTEDQVRVIKARLHNGETYRAIAKDYGVSSGTIGHIKYGKTWTHVEFAT